MEIHGLKSRSPPPKPPRRRHSDQSSLSTSGTLSSNKKYDATTCSNLIKDKLKINNSSGCDSLPANWVVDSDINLSSNDLPINNNLHVSSNSEHSFKKIPDVSFDNKNNTNLNKNIFDTNSYNFEVNSISSAHLYSLQNNLKHPISNKLFYENTQSQLLLNNRVESFSFSLAQNILHKTIKSPKIFRHRHYSDSLLYLDKALNKNNSHRESQLNSSFFDQINYNKHVKWESSLSDFGRHKEISCLYEEIKILKDINDKLWSHLCLMQADLESNSKFSSQNSFSLSEFLSQLYYAQKSKEKILEERLQIAYEDRDEAVVHLEEMLQTMAKSFDNSSHFEEESFDKEVKEFLHKLENTSTPKQALYYQNMLLALLYRSKEYKQSRLSHELKIVTIERDNALEKIKQLEKEIKLMEVSNEIRHSDFKHWEFSLLDMLCQVIEQRDYALSKDKFPWKNQHVEYSSPRKMTSLASFQHLNSDYDSSQKMDDSSFTFNFFPLTQADANASPELPLDASNEIHSLKEKFIALSKLYEKEIKSREKAEENNHRLERLVSVLRKKINKQCISLPT